jgi:hypothetical protein
MIPLLLAQEVPGVPALRGLPLGKAALQIIRALLAPEALRAAAVVIPQALLLVEEGKTRAHRAPLLAREAQAAEILTNLQARANPIKNVRLQRNKLLKVDIIAIVALLRRPLMAALPVAAEEAHRVDRAEVPLEAQKRPLLKKRQPKEAPIVMAEDGLLLDKGQTRAA